MKRRIKNNLKVVLVSMLSIAMILPVFHGLALKANAATTEAAAEPATLKGSTLTLDGSLKTNVITEVKKATLGKKELTFSDFGMADGTPDAVSTIYSCNAGYSSWDGLTLTGYVKFGNTSNCIYVGTGVGTYEYSNSLWIQANSSNELTLTSYQKTPDGKKVRIFENASSTVAITPTIQVEDENVNLLTDEVKLTLSFDYTDIFVDVQILINDTLYKTITLKHSEKTPTANAGDALGMGISSAVAVRSVQEYEEVTFSDFGMEDGVQDQVKRYICQTGYTSWDGLTLTGYVRFGGSGKNLFVGTGVHDASSHSIAFNHAAGTETNCLTITAYLQTPEGTKIRTKDESGKDTATATIQVDGVDFTTDEVKLSLSFDYTGTGVDMKVFINDTYCKTITFYDKTNAKASTALGMGIESQVASVRSIAKASEYKEVTFANFGMPAEGTLLASQEYVCNTKYTSWDGLTLTGYVKFGSGKTARRLFVGTGANDNTSNSLWIEQDTSDSTVANQLKLTCEFKTPNEEKVRLNDGDELVNAYNAYITVPNVNFATDEVKLSLSFDYTVEGVDMRVSINDTLYKTITLKKVLNKTNDKASDALGMGIACNNDAISVKSTPYMSFEFENGNKDVVPLSQAVRTPAYGALHYAFSYEMAAKEMTDSVTVQFHNGNQVSEEKTYTIKDYANTIIANDGGVYSEDAISLAKAVLNYGSAAQRYRDYKADSLANPNFAVSEEVTAETLKPYAKSKQSHDEIATLTSTSLMLESETTLKMYFTFADGVSREDFIFTDGNGNTLETIASGNRYCVVFENIKANELGRDCIVTITHKDNASLTHSYSYSVLSYCYVALTYYKDNNAKEPLKTLAKTMYLYNQEADYFARNKMLAKESETGLAYRIYSGMAADSHLQGTTMGDGYVYFSYADRLIKVDMLSGEVVASVNMFETAHLGGLAFYDGKIYGVLDCAMYKTDVENKFHVAVFDADKITQMDMDYHSVLTTMSISELNLEGYPYTVDGITFGPKPGDTSGKTYMVLATDLNNDKSDYYQVLLAYDVDKLITRKLDDSAQPHAVGVSSDEQWYVKVSPKTYSAQQLEYNADQKEYWLIQYPSTTDGYLNEEINVVDATIAPIEQDGKNVLSFKAGIGESDETTGVSGIKKMPTNAAEGFIALGNDYYYVANSAKNSTNGVYSGVVKLYKFNREDSTFSVVWDN